MLGRQSTGLDGPLERRVFGFKITGMRVATNHWLDPGSRIAGEVLSHQGGGTAQKSLCLDASLGYHPTECAFTDLPIACALDSSSKARIYSRFTLGKPSRKSAMESPALSAISGLSTGLYEYR